VKGHALKKPLKAGHVILRADLAEAPAIRRGDSIRVEVQSGPARLRFDAIAEESACLGHMVELRNPVNGKIFKARVDSPSLAVIVVNGTRQSL